MRERGASEDTKALQPHSHLAPSGLGQSMGYDVDLSRPGDNRCLHLIGIRFFAIRCGNPVHPVPSCHSPGPATFTKGFDALVFEARSWSGRMVWRAWFPIELRKPARVPKSGQTSPVKEGVIEYFGAIALSSYLRCHFTRWIVCWIFRGTFRLQPWFGKGGLHGSLQNASRFFTQFQTKATAKTPRNCTIPRRKKWLRKH